MSRHYHSLLNVLTSAAFSYAKSSYHQDEADPTPTITGTAGGTFSATPSGLSINTSTGTIDLDNSTIQSYTITYTVSGVSSSQSLAVTASPLVANTFSMQFDGASTYVTAGNPTALQFTSDFSISGWFKSSSSTKQTIISKVDNTNSSYLLRINSNGSIKAVVYTGGTAQVNESTTTGYADGNWHHFVFTFENGVGTKLYIDNGTPNTDSFTNSIDNDSADFEIGRKGDNSNFMNGKIDEVAIWNAALSSDAVQEIYNATYNNTGKALDLSTDYNNYTSSSNLQYWNRLGD